jgi:hypothetical protein
MKSLLIAGVIVGLLALPGDVRAACSTNSDDCKAPITKEEITKAPVPDVPDPKKEIELACKSGESCRTGFAVKDTELACAGASTDDCRATGTIGTRSTLVPEEKPTR